LFGGPLSSEQLHDIAASLGSDIPFFLQSQPALATGRGECIQPLQPFLALRDVFAVLIHPGFGIPTAWAYQNLSRFPDALNGRRGRAQRLVDLLNTPDLITASREFYNSLEAPVLDKYPILALFQEFLRENDAAPTLMSGSGSSTFALFQNSAAAEEIASRFRKKFGENCWIAIVPL